MTKEDILVEIESNVRKEMEKVQYHCFKVNKDERIYCEYIYFPNGDYLFDRYMEYVGTLTDDAFIPQLKLGYREYKNGIDEAQLMEYIGRNLRVDVFGDDTLTISYDDTETFDEIVSRLYNEVLEYAKDCYRKEYLAEHTEVKMYDVKDFYGKWIDDYKPSQFKGIEQGDFISVKVEYTDDEGGFDIKVGWYDKYINDNGYNIFLSNVDGEYKITAWCCLPKVI